MPGLNHKGPAGEGSGTGRRLGRCNSVNKGKTIAEIRQGQQQADPFMKENVVNRGRRGGCQHQRVRNSSQRGF